MIPDLPQGTPSPPGSPWPQPLRLQRDNEVFGVDPYNFRFDGDVDACDVIEEAIVRYKVKFCYFVIKYIVSILETKFTLRETQVGGTQVGGTAVSRKKLVLFLIFF